jgi:Flp pilus assembly protein TadD
MARLAADEGRYDEALSRIDRVIAKSPDDPVLRYERAMMLIDAGKVDRARTSSAPFCRRPPTSTTRTASSAGSSSTADTDRARVEEALRYLQAAFKAYPDDLSTGMAVAHILNQLERLPRRSACWRRWSSVRPISVLSTINTPRC